MFTGESLARQEMVCWVSDICAEFTKLNGGVTTWSPMYTNFTII